ncbi:hypothetical protein NDU88_011028 [Pleurodeles waltl]|uniref:Uncharacterized protein n=1 Tax=Pleurodeles waltl TaxID=8319 RepID=A0AAV7S101_PLEWA|nr:hypothetical protein NDU88_011028 [Pleurodeles waltl]
MQLLAPCTERTVLGRLGLIAHSGHAEAAGAVVGPIFEETLPYDGDLLATLGCVALECVTGKLCTGYVGSGTTLALLLHGLAPRSCGGRELRD